MSYLAKGKGCAKKVERYLIPRAAICGTSVASAWARSSLDCRTYSPGSPCASFNLRNGPAANAIRYVLIGRVSWKAVRRCRDGPREELSTGVLDTIVQLS